MALFLLQFSIGAKAQTPVSFGSCPSTLFISHVAPGSTAPMHLYSLGFPNSPGVLEHNLIGTASAIYGVNAIGFHPGDKFIYGIKRDTNQLLKIGQNNVVVNLGVIAGLPVASYNTGEIDADGIYWVKKQGVNSVIYRIIINTLAGTATAQAVGLNISIATNDFAYNVIDKCLYGVSNATLDRLFKIDLSNNGTSDKTVTLLGETNISPSIFGAMYVNGLTGEVFGQENNGKFYKFQSTGVATFIGQLLGGGEYDGAHCATSAITFPADLSIVKTDFNSVYVAGTQIVYTIRVKNLGPFTATNAVVVDNLPNGIPVANMSYTKIDAYGVNTWTQGAPINDVITLEKDASVVYYVYLDIPANYSGDLINKATVAVDLNKNTDPNDSNNSATDTDTQCLPPAITAQPVATKSACLNATLTSLSVTASGTANLSYQWYSNATNSTTGGTAINAATSASYTPPSTAIGTIYYYVIVTGVCPSSNTVTSTTSAVTISNAVSISGQPLSTQTICQNATSSNLTVTTSGSPISYQWYSNATNTNSGGTLIASATNVSYTPLTTTIGTKYYYVVATGNCNIVTSSTSAVIVTASTAITTQPATSQTVCQYTTPTTLSVTASGTGTLTYQWYFNTTGGNTTGTAISSETASSYTPPARSTTSTTYYYVIVSGTCGSVTSSASAVTDTAVTAITAQPATTQTICRNATPATLSLTASGTGTLTYQWYSNASNNTTGGTAINLATTSTYVPSSTTVGTTYYYVIASGTCGSVTSSTSAVIVTASTAITAQPATTQTVCQYTTPTTLSVTASGTGILTYQWYWNTTGGNTTGNAISSETNSSYTPPARSTTGTTYYYVIVSGTCGSVTSSTSAVTDTAITAITTQPATSQTVCQYTTPTTLSVTASGTGTLTYQWYWNTTGGNTTGNAISSETNSSYTPPARSTTGTTYYYVIVSGTCGSVTSSTSAVTDTAITAITIQPATSQTVCQYTTPTTLSVTASGTGTLTYQWYWNTTGGNTTGTAISSETASSYTPPARSTTSTTYYYVIVSGTCGSVTSSASAVTDTAVTAITAQPATTQTICRNATPSTLSVTASGTGTLTYQWYSNATNSNTGGTAIDLATSSTYVPSSTMVGTTYYYVIASSTCGIVTSSTSAVVVNALTIIPNAPTSIVVVQQDEQVTALSISSATGTNLTYQWYSNTTYSTSGGTLIEAATATTYTPSSSILGTKYYYAIVTGSCGAETSLVNGVTVIEKNCNKPAVLDPAAGTTLGTEVGISALNRVGVTSTWPKVRESGWIALEAKTKGFVINRVAFNGAGLPVVGTTLVLTSPVEGMMVYDTTNNCLKVYTTTDGINFAWFCMETQTCPE